MANKTKKRKQNPKTGVRLNGLDRYIEALADDAAKNSLTGKRPDKSTLIRDCTEKGIHVILESLPPERRKQIQKAAEAA